MSSHKIRLATIAVLAAICLVGVIVLVALGQAEGTGFGILTGMLSTLVPALLDASAVEVRRRDPSRPALPDDVREPPSARTPAAAPSQNDSA